MSLSAAGGRYQPIPTQAEITRKVQYDHVEAHQREINAGDTYINKGCFKNGQNKALLKVKRGEIIFGRRVPRQVRNHGGRMMETGLSSLNGADFSYTQNNKEAFMRSIYHIGITKSDYEDGDDSFGHVDPIEHGFAVIGSGSVSVHNKSSEPIHAGDDLCMDIPDFNATGMPHTERGGLPAKLTPFYRPFHRTTCRSSLLAMHACLTRNKNDRPNPGIVGLTPEEKEYNTDLSPLQEETLGLLEFVRAIAPEADPKMSEKAVAVYVKQNLAAFQALGDAMTSAIYARMSRIVGRAMTSSMPGQSTSVMLSHFKCI